MIVTVTLNPCIDLTLFTEGVALHDSNKVLRAEMDAGGKGVNLSRMVTELGGQTFATGFLGGETGRHIEAMLRQKGVPHEFVEVADETRTNVSVESGDGPPTVLNVPGAKVTGLEWENLLAKVAEHVNKDDWVALGGSIPPGVPVEAYKILGQMVKSMGARLLLDADKEPLRHGLEAGPDLVKPNRDEAERLLGVKIETVEQAVEGAKLIQRELKAKGSERPIAVITLGSEGAVLASDSDTLVGRALGIHARSTIGSGDSFLGGFLCSLDNSNDVREAFRIAIAAGAATAESDGTRIGTREEVDTILGARSGQLEVHGV